MNSLGAASHTSKNLASTQPLSTLHFFSFAAMVWLFCNCLCLYYEYGILMFAVLLIFASNVTWLIWASHLVLMLMLQHFLGLKCRTSPQFFRRLLIIHLISLFFGGELLICQILFALFYQWLVLSRLSFDPYFISYRFDLVPRLLISFWNSICGYKPSMAMCSLSFVTAGSFTGICFSIIGHHVPPFFSWVCSI